MQRARPAASPPPGGNSPPQRAVVPRTTVLVSAERQAREVLSAACVALAGAARINAAVLASFGASAGEGGAVLAALFSPSTALALSASSVAAAIAAKPQLAAAISRCVVKGAGVEPPPRTLSHDASLSPC